MANVTRVEQRNDRQYLVFDDPGYQAYYDALFALGEPGSPTPFDVNSAADLSKLGIIGVQENTGEEYLSHPLKFDPNRSVRTYSIQDPNNVNETLWYRSAEDQKQFAEMEHTDPNRWAEEKRKVELHLTHKHMARHIKKLMEGQVMIVDPEAGEYPKKLKFVRDNTGRVVAQFEGIPRNAPVDKKPVPPKQPGGWVRMWHRVSKRLFRGTMREYEQRKARYERELAAYQRNDAYRRVADKEWPKYAEAAKAKREQQHQTWMDQNQAAFVQDRQNAEASVEAFRNSVQEDLSRAFANAKPGTATKLMIDNITINGKTIKSILYERLSAGHQDDDQISAEYLSSILPYRDNLQQSTIVDIVTAALAKQARVEVFPLDEHGRLETGAPQVWSRQAPASNNSRQIMQEKSSQWLPELREESKSTILARVDDSRKLISRRNLIYNYSSKNPPMERAILGPWLQENHMTKESFPSPFRLSTSRTALTSHALAWLALNTDLSPQDIFDPTKAPELKAKAGAEVCQHYVDNDLDWFMNLNNEGSIKLGSMLHSYLKENQIDVRDKDVVYRPENIWILNAAHVGQDLDQEYTNMDVEMAKRVDRQEAARRRSDPKVEEAAQYRAAYAWLARTADGTQQAIDAILGDQYALTSSFSIIAARELQTAAGYELMSKSDKLPEATSAMMLNFIATAAAPESEFDISFRVGTKFKNLADRQQVARWAYNGNVSKHFAASNETGMYQILPKNPKKQVSELVQAKQPVVNQPQQKLP